MRRYYIALLSLSHSFLACTYDAHLRSSETSDAGADARNDTGLTRNDTGLIRDAQMEANGGCNGPGLGRPGCTNDCINFRSFECQQGSWRCPDGTQDANNFCRADSGTSCRIGDPNSCPNNTSCNASSPNGTGTCEATPIPNDMHLLNATTWVGDTQLNTPNTFASHNVTPCDNPSDGSGTQQFLAAGGRFGYCGHDITTLRAASWADLGNQPAFLIRLPRQFATHNAHRRFSVGGAIPNCSNAATTAYLEVYVESGSTRGWFALESGFVDFEIDNETGNEYYGTYIGRFEGRVTVNGQNIVTRGSFRIDPAFVFC